MSTLSESFESDLIKLENLVHSIKVMNTDTQSKLFDFEENIHKDKMQIADLEPMYRNSFSINEVLELISEMRFSERFTEYANSLYYSEHNNEMRIID